MFYLSKLYHLKNFISKFKQVLVVYSGGVDSTLILKVSADVLGKKNIIAVTALSETYPEIDKYFAKLITKKLDVKHVFIKTDELKNPKFKQNSSQRCYYCKKELFSKISELAKKYNIHTIFDGTNYNDLSDFRPGKVAIKEYNIISPLLETKITKDDIRKISKYLQLPTWNKPQSPCLASRIPYGIEINKSILRKIEQGENFLRKSGFTDVRLRHYNKTARIEVLSDQIRLFSKDKIRKELIKNLKLLGYKYITLDLEGYRTGNLNL